MLLLDHFAVHRPARPPWNPQEPFRDLVDHRDPAVPVDDDDPVEMLFRIVSMNCVRRRSSS